MIPKHFTLGGGGMVSVFIFLFFWLTLDSTQDYSQQLLGDNMVPRIETAQKDTLSPLTSLSLSL